MKPLKHWPPAPEQNMSLEEYATLQELTKQRRLRTSREARLPVKPVPRPPPPVREEPEHWLTFWFVPLAILLMTVVVVLVSYLYVFR